MSRQREKESSSLRKVTSATRSIQKKRNLKTLARLKGTGNEKHKLRNITKGDEDRAKQGSVSDVRSLTGARSLNGKLKESTSQNPECGMSSDFQMLRIHHEEDEESNEDYLSMMSLDSRPSSYTTARLHEEWIFRNEDEFESSENFNKPEREQNEIKTEETFKSGSSSKLVSDDIGSPRLQIIQLEGQNKENMENLEKSVLDSTNVSIQEKMELEKESESERKTQSKLVKTAWELNDKFNLTSDFPAAVWEDEKPNKKLLTTRRRSSDLLSASFPPLSAYLGSRRGSFPITPINYWFSSSKTPPELPSLSGRQCKVQLPSSFPGVCSPTSESESESSDDELDEVFREKEQVEKKIDQKLLKNYLEVPNNKQTQKKMISSERASPTSSGSSIASSEHLAMRAASTEYLAARVVTQLNCAFEETVGENERETTSRANCVTPNLMPRRHSALFFRSNTSNCFEEKAASLILPSVQNECSKSLPNLSGYDKTKRMFVTFDKNSPHVKVVDLKGNCDLARKCRLINRRLTNEDSVVKQMLKEKVHKKSMIKKWVLSSAQGI